jgi:transcriptional regulator with XRE-family HTH domain
MTNDIDRHLGKRLRQRRRLLGQTQQQIAEAVGVRFQQIQKYECGSNRISAARLWLLAKALDAPVGSFFEGIDDDIDGVDEDDGDSEQRKHFA